MSWHYSQALEAAYSEANSSGGAASAPSSGTNTPAPCSSPDKMTEACQPSQSGTMCGPSTDAHGAVWWMSYLAASRAKISAPQAKALASTVPALASGLKWHESFARWDRATCSWKTPQCSLLAGLDEWSETWPRWGMMRNGECWELTTPVLHTAETESGSWPTPRSSDGERGGRGDLIQAVRGNPNSHYRLWSPPVADDAIERTAGKWNSRGEPKLSAQVKLWPTPTVNGNYNRKGLTPTSGDGLATAVKMWPTPNASDAGKWSHQSLEERMAKGQQVRLNTAVAPEGGRGGSLNPTWVEWLMGWPLGWTDCAASATDKCRQWCASHGIFFTRSKAKEAA
jgi:hypothetical protein